HRRFKARNQSTVGVGARIGNRIQRLGVLDDAADIVESLGGKTGVLVTGEHVLAAFAEGLVHMHTTTVVANQRLGHESGSFAISVRYVVYAILEDLYLIGLAHQGVELHTDFALARCGHFMVVDFHRQAHLLGSRTHGSADIVERVDGRNGKVTAFYAWPVARVAFLISGVGIPGRFGGIDIVARGTSALVPLYVVENKEFGF